MCCWWDDIYTTGATARACSRALVEAGAASVSVATLARAQRRVPARIVESRRYLRLVEAERDGPEEDEEILPENWMIQ